MEPNVRISLMMVPVIVLASLAALSIAIVVLRMIFSQRYRFAGVTVLALGCFGAMLVAGMLFTYRARSAAQHQLRAVEMLRMEELRAQAHEAELRAMHESSNAQLSIESAMRIERENASAEVASGASFDELDTDETDSPPEEVTVTESMVPDDGEAVPAADEKQPTSLDANSPDNNHAESHSEPFRLDGAPSIVTYDIPKPWLVENDEFDFEGFPAKVVSSHPAPDVTTCVGDLTKKLADECYGYVRSYTPWNINVTPELIACAIRDEHVESIGGSQKVVHKLLVFDRDFKQQADIEINNAKVTSRLGKTGIVSGIVLSSLTGLFGILSFTHRRRESRLSS